MAGWTTQKTWAFQEGVESSELNTYLRDDMNFIRPLIVRKTADQTVTSNTSLQNATDMLIPIGASETWTIELRGMYSVHGTPDWKQHWSTPSGATGNHWIVGSGVSQQDVIANDIVVAGIGGAMTWTSYATIINSTTAGNVQFQFAQFTSDANGVTMFTNSVMVGMRIA